MKLIFDIVKLIASFDKDTWYNLYRVDERFYEYARTDIGIREYIKLATEHTIDKYVKETRLFGKLHSIYGEPAYISVGGNQSWYKNGVLHREGDLPAVISTSNRQAHYSNSCSKEWYKDGHLHRDGDLPAVECISGMRSWYKDGKKHRDGDLAAVIHDKNNQYWYKDGIFIKQFRTYY